MKAMRNLSIMADFGPDGETSQVTEIIEVQNVGEGQGSVSLTFHR